MGDGCGEFDYGYEPVAPPGNTAPTATATAAPPGDGGRRSTTSSRASASTDAETPDNLDYSWDFGDGGRAEGQGEGGGVSPR